jgi:hypothetical protein
MTAPGTIERGSALIVVLFLVTVLSLLGIGVMATAMMDLKISDSYTRSLKALYAADAGLNQAVALLEYDPNTGNVAPNPTGTPFLQEQFYDGNYSLWMWNRRVRGNGVTEDFPIPGSRQVVVLGSDGYRSSRRLEAIVIPSRRAPKALDYATFSCAGSTMNNGDVQGTMYASGDISWAGTSPAYVNAEALGAYSGTKDLKNGWVHANGSIGNNSSKAPKGCRTAGNTITKVSNCNGIVATNVSPAPVREYCDMTSADWDPGMLDLTEAEVQVYRDQTDPLNHHDPGWAVGSGTLTLPQRVWVSGGNATFTGTTLRYTGDTVLLVDGGNFVCSACKIEMGPAGAYLTIITSSGNMTFTGSAASKFIGVLWAGVWTATGPPAAGSISVASNYDLKIKGEVVAAGGTISNTSKLHAYLNAGKPPHFGDLTGFAISEWRETR